MLCLQQLYCILHLLSYSNSQMQTGPPTEQWSVYIRCRKKVQAAESIWTSAFNFLTPCLLYYLLPSLSRFFNVLGTNLIVKETLQVLSSFSPQLEFVNGRFATFSDTTSWVLSAIPCRWEVYMESLRIRRLFGSSKNEKMLSLSSWHCSVVEVPSVTCREGNEDTM